MIDHSTADRLAVRRTLEFADRIMEVTHREGVDVVLNSLAGEFIPRSLATLRAGGRFLEIGMVDILQNNPLGLREFHKNLSFSSVNLAHMFVSRAAFCGACTIQVDGYPTRSCVTTIVGVSRKARCSWRNTPFDS